jgi:serine phosphatase RsbU (regulator of sigma subunit)
MKVLIVDDNPRDAELSLMTLRRSGTAVEYQIASDEAELRGVLQTFIPDVILCDFAFPNFDGISVQRIVQKVRAETPLIFVSGTISEETAVIALKSGAVDYVLKSNLVRLPSAVHRAVKEAREKQRLLKSLRGSEGIRETFSAAFVPLPLPEITDLAFDAVYLPADEEARVGGDWYDVIQLDGDHVLVSIGDVAGHGLAAALSTVKLRQAIIGSALDERDPAAILHRAGRAFALVDDSIATALVVIFDRRSRRFRYAIAGHPAPIVATPGHAALLPGVHGIPLGIDPKMRYESFEHALLDGELLVFYTDGLIEARHTIIEDELRLLAASREAAAGRFDARGVAHAMLGTTPIPDDVAILTLRIADACR